VRRLTLGIWACDSANLCSVRRKQGHSAHCLKPALLADNMDSLSARKVAGSITSNRLDVSTLIRLVVEADRT
jgi:hypothetical protein